jgi:DNA polymerase
MGIFSLTKIKIAIVGEAYGAEEERQQTPFVGMSGYQLNQLLKDAGIDRSTCHVTNVFNLRPEKNDIETLCGSKAEGIPGRGPIRAGKYILAKHAPELVRLESELKSVNPNLVLALGATAAWATLGTTGIRKIRGTISQGVHELKILPTYHPAAIMRQWELRPVTVLDFMKAKRQSEFPEIRRPNRQIWIEPTIRDLTLFEENYLRSASKISVDIETVQDIITCIGFAPNKSVCLVVPFTRFGAPGNVYWSESDEFLAWKWVRKICESSAKKVFQNGLYDTHFLWRRYGIPVRNWQDDTMLLHHALQPESPKGLDFLGSVYTDEPAWKLMRKKTTTIKRDE